MRCLLFELAPSVSGMLVSNLSCKPWQSLFDQMIQPWIVPQVVQDRDKEQVFQYDFRPEVWFL